MTPRRRWPAHGLSLEFGNTLPDTSAQLISRRGVTRSTVEPAVLS